MGGMMKLTWLGHSCFKAECEGSSVVLDPFEPGSVPGCRDIQEEADLVLCSHEHYDHGYRAGVKLTGRACPIQVTSLQSFHDGEQGAKRGPNVIHILEGGGVKAAHFGDIGCMPSPEQIEALQGCDVVMVPVGGFYTVGPEEAKKIVDAVGPRVVIPMHYRSDAFGFDVLGTVDEYLDICGRWVRYEGASMEITPDMPRHTAVLQYE
ncbi:MAG: MBL fold metallo-hydrolase [Acutalibacter sp.]|nr:MBL fold metallo-hydrolase [Acutalibacter sp.]